MKARRISRPSSVRIGIFCRFGFVDDIRPVAVAVWLNVVWIFPVEGFMRVGNAFTYVVSSFLTPRISRIRSTNGCEERYFSRISSVVAYAPVFVFLLSGQFSGG